MTVPFVDLLIKMKARLFPAAESKASPSRLVRVEKPSGQRLSKTVLPSAARARATTEPFQVSAGAGSIEKVAQSPGPRSISFDPARRSSGTREMSKTVPIVPEEPVERAISLQIADILDQLPGDYIKPPDAFDTARAIVLKASEIEKGMASGKPSISLASIYEQVPEIFLNSVSPSDATSVLLPFTKVLEQFEKLQVRSDQVRDNSVPQLETPFLKVTLEDTERFGTTMQPLQTSSHPPVKVEPAIAETLAAAEPEPVVSEMTRAKPSLRPTIPLHELDPAGSTSFAPEGSSDPVTKQHRDVPRISPPKIPFHLPPNGTGEPASEKVPASCGPSVPTIPSTPTPARIPTPEKVPTSSAPSAPTIPAPPTPARIPTPEKIPASSAPSAPTIPASPTPARIPSPEKVPASSGPSAPTVPASQTPARIPFKFTAPCDDIRPKFTLVPGVEPETKAPPPKKPTTATSDGTKIALSLQSILQEVPAFQLNGSPLAVPEDVRVEFPLSLIEPQLASGRVMVPARVFQRAIPEMHRELFVVDLNETPVSLALPEILKHLPSTALRMRDDQEEVAVKGKFTTPFSIQADEDEKRFNATADVPKVSEEPAKKPQDEKLSTIAPTKTEQVEEKAAEEKIDAKQAIARATALPGVAACAITFADGLSLADNIPGELDAEGICAIVPTLLERIDNYLLDTKLGSLNAMTLQCAKSPLTFFMHENICLAAVHADGGDLTAQTRAQLAEVVQELSRTYAQPEPSHVDH